MTKVGANRAGILGRKVALLLGKKLVKQDSSVEVMTGLEGAFQASFQVVFVVARHHG